MLRPYTASIVTLVQHEHSVRDVAYKKLVRLSVRKNISVGHAKKPIPVLHTVRTPLPASGFCNADFLHEAL